MRRRTRLRLLREGGMSGVKVTTLANGLRVAADAMPEVEIGLARHLGRLRHAPRDWPSSTAWRICSSTWRSRARATRSARAIAEEIENVGGSLNAYTGREITAYHASVLKEDVALGVEHGRPTSCATRCSIPTSCSASAASSCRRSARRSTRPTT